MTPLAEAQRTRLEQAAEALGDWLGPVCFHACRGDNEALEPLRDRSCAGGASGALAWRLCARFDSVAAESAVLDLAARNTDPWVAFTLTKALLRQQDVPGALEAVKLHLAHGGPDTCSLNLIALYLADAGAVDLARQVARQSLAQAPSQWDMRRLADGGQAAPLPPLKPCPAPAVDFYVPLYNAEAYAEAAVEAMLAQHHPIGQVIAVDDGSPDASAEIAARYPIEVIRHGENRGLAAARNTAVEASTAQFVASIDADVVPDATYLTRALMEFELCHAALVGVGGRLIEAHTDTPADAWRARFLSQDGGKVRWHGPPLGAETADLPDDVLDLSRYLLPGCNTVLKRQAVLDAGGYDPECRTNSEDGVLCDALVERGGQFTFTPHAVAHHQRRDTPASVLRTAWNYALRLRTEQGKYDSMAGFAALLQEHVGRTRWGFERDVTDGRQDLLALDILYFYHSNAHDLRHMLRLGRLLPGEARAVQDAVLDALPAATRAGVVRSLGGPCAEVPPSPLPEALRAPVAALTNWLRSLPDAQLQTEHF